MKKTAITLISLAICSAMLFSGCKLFSTDIISGDESDTDATTGAGTAETVAQAIPVTDASGELVTNEGGEIQTTIQYVEVEPSSSVPAVTTPDVPSSAAPDVNATTAPSNDTSTPAQTTAQSTPEPTTSGGSAAPVTGTTEYDVLRSGNFYLKGTMTSDNETVPLEIALTANTVYMTSNMDGISVGLLIDPNKKVYMMIDDKKIYLEMSSAVMNYLGMNVDDLISSDSINFSSYKPLNQANSVSDVVVNGVSCKEYVFNQSDGTTTRVYMNGSKLVRFASFEANGTLISASDIASISANVPANKMSPPADYKGYSGVTGLLGFMSQCADLMT